MIAMAVPVPGGHRPLALAVSGPLDRMRRNKRGIIRLLARKLEGLSI